MLFNTTRNYFTARGQHLQRFVLGQRMLITAGHYHIPSTREVTTLQTRFLCIARRIPDSKRQRRQNLRLRLSFPRQP
jgi:hypothetical protein